MGMSQSVTNVRKEDAKDVVRSLGLVFGDIGTSPIYTLTVIFLTLTAEKVEITETLVIEIVSLIIWTLIILVNIEYA